MACRKTRSPRSYRQTRDGYLWLGTFGGLTRFDGVRFAVFDSSNTPVLRSNRILSLAEDRWGRLWIGTELGDVYIEEKGDFRKFNIDSKFNRRTVWAIATDDLGDLFISSDSGLDRFGFDAGGNYIDGSAVRISEQATYGLFKHPDGSIWVRIKGKVYQINKDRLLPPDPDKYPLPVNILRMDIAPDGAMLCGGADTIDVSSNGKFNTLFRPVAPLDQAGFAVKVIDGSYCFQSGDQLTEYDGTRVVDHPISEFVHNGSRTIFRDKEGNIWLGTNGEGLVRLTKRKISLLSEVNGFDTTSNSCLAEDRDGAVWVGGVALQKVKDGKVTTYKRSTGNWAYPLIKSLAFDASGRLWVGGAVGLFYFADERLVPVQEFADREIFALFFDRDGALWIGGMDGLWRYANGNVERFTTENGLVSNNVHFITQTKDGAIWIGRVDGVSRYSNGTFKNITDADGLSGSNVRAIYEDQDGTIWFGTYGGGLMRYLNGKISTITSKNGLYDNFISRILTDDQDRLWLLSNMGISAVSRTELNAVADGREMFIAGPEYGASDGMSSSEANGGTQPAGIRTSDGRLWFPMLKDVVIVDPATTDKIPPKVIIESASSRLAGDQRTSVRNLFGEGEEVRVDDTNRNLEIQFTGLSFTKPEKIRFFYKLGGLDSEWTDAGSRRVAFYPYLPPGNYTFYVKAVNADGVWSENIATLSIDVAKNFWQTWWFATIVLLVIAAVVMLIYRSKVRQLRFRQLEQEAFSKRLIIAHETERSRIATELHDSLGQELLVIKNLARSSLGSLSDTPKVQDRLEQISSTASDAIEETRTIVRNLSPQNLSRFGLTEAINNMLEQAQDSTATFSKRTLWISTAFLTEKRRSAFTGSSRSA